MNTQLSHAESKPPIRSTRRWSLPAPRPSDPRKVMIVLAVCMALQMTSFVMILPLFARRFSEFGTGVEALGASAMAFALASTLTAPFMGALADRFGRRPLVLVSLAAYVLAFSGYLLASSALAFILTTSPGRRLHCRPRSSRDRHRGGPGSDGTPGAVDRHRERRGGDRLDRRSSPGRGALRPLGNWGAFRDFDHHGSGDIYNRSPDCAGDPQGVGHPAAKAARSERHFRPGNLISSAAHS